MITSSFKPSRTIQGKEVCLFHIIWSLTSTPRHLCSGLTPVAILVGESLRFLGYCSLPSSLRDFRNSGFSLWPKMCLTQKGLSWYCTSHLISSGICLNFDTYSWLFGITILYFGWLQSCNIYALLISINKLTWLLLHGEHYVHSVFHPEIWKMVILFAGQLVTFKKISHSISVFCSSV